MTELRRNIFLGTLWTGVIIGLILVLTKIDSSGAAIEHFGLEITPNPVFIGGLIVMILSGLCLVVLRLTGKNKR